MKIRDASKNDCKQIAQIYNYYIENTAITYEYEKLDDKEIYRRMSSIVEKFPYLVCLDGENVVGYIYCKQYIEREACLYSVEASLYVDHNHIKMGIGKMLYQQLIRRLE